MDQTLGDHGHHPVPLTAPLGSEETLEPELAEGPQDRLDVAMRRGPFDDQQLADRHELLASQDPPQGLDLVGRPVGQIGEGAFPHLPAFAVRLPEQDRGTRVPIADGVDVHGNDNSISHYKIK